MPQSELRSFVFFPYFIGILPTKFIILSNKPQTPIGGNGDAL